MGIIDTVLCALGLAADAFAASVCKGTEQRKPTKLQYAAVGLWFGLFQAVMPVLGCLLGVLFCRRIAAIDHFIAFFLLAFIGFDMIFSSREKISVKAEKRFSSRTMIPLAFGTSVDAFAAGITFSFSGGLSGILFACVTIGCVTAFLCVLGLKIGSVFGTRSGKNAQRAGGALLILLGFKILVEHLISEI